MVIYNINLRRPQQNLGKLYNVIKYLFILYLKVGKHQIHKTVYIKKIAMYKVTIYTC